MTLPKHLIHGAALAATLGVAQHASAYCDYWGCYDDPTDPYDTVPAPVPPAPPPPGSCNGVCTELSNYYQGCTQEHIGCSYVPPGYCDYWGCYYDPAPEECPVGFEYTYSTSTTCGAIGVYDGWSGPGVSSTPPVATATTCTGGGAGQQQVTDPPKKGDTGWFKVDTNVKFLHGFKDWKLKLGAEAKVSATVAKLSGDVIKAEAVLETTTFGGASHGPTDEVTQSYVRVNVLGVDVWQKGKMTPSGAPNGFTPPALPVKKENKDQCTYFQQMAAVRPDTVGSQIRAGTIPRSCSSWPVATEIPKVNKVKDLGNLVSWANNMTFFQAAVAVPLGPGTVNLHFKAGGSVGAKLAMAPVKEDGTGKLLGGTFGVSPTAGVWVGAGISVNFWVVAAGVNARVNLITASYNPTVAATFEEPDNIASRLHWNFEHYVETKALDGYVEPWLRLLFATFKKQWSWGPAWQSSSQVVPSSPKCAQATCGNGVCGSGETSTNCPTDCPPPPPPPPPTAYCGDGICAGSEVGWCIEDCGSNPCNTMVGLSEAELVYCAY